MDAFLTFWRRYFINPKTQCERFPTARTLPVTRKRARQPSAIWQQCRFLSQVYLGDVCNISDVGNKAGSQLIIQPALFCRILEFLPFQMAMTCRRLNTEADRIISQYFRVETLPLDEIWYPGWDKFVDHGGEALEAVLARSTSSLRKITAKADYFSVPIEVLECLITNSHLSLEVLDILVTTRDRLPMIPMSYITCLTSTPFDTSFEQRNLVHELSDRIEGNDLLPPHSDLLIFPHLSYIRWQVTDTRGERYLPLPFIKRMQCPALVRLEVQDKVFESLCHWDSQWEESSYGPQDSLGE